MDIDSFFTDGDLSFGMDGASPKFKDFVGTGQNVLSGKQSIGYEFNKYPEYGFTDDIYSSFSAENVSLENTFNNIAGDGAGQDFGVKYWNATGVSRLDQPSEWYVKKLTDADKANCEKLQGLLDTISKDISSNNTKAVSAKSGEKRVLADYNKGLQIAAGKIMAFMSTAKCKIKEDAAFDKSLSEISGSSGSSRMILYTGIAIAAIGLGIVLYKKLKK